MMKRVKSGISIALILPMVGFTGTAAAAMITDTVTASTTGDFNATHDLKRYDSTLYRPRDNAVTVSGNVDISNVSDGGAILIGLVDAGFYDNSGDAQFSGIADPFGINTPTYQSGAYAYFTPPSGPRDFGPSDGNNGGEVVQNFGSLNGNTNIDFSLTVAPDGSIVVAYAGQSVTDSYGDTKSRPLFDFGEAYPYEEFANGAYLAVDFAAGGGPGMDSAEFSLSAMPEAGGTDVPEPGSFAMLGIGVLATLGLFTRRRKTG